MTPPVPRQTYQSIVLHYLPSMVDEYYTNIAVIVHDPRTKQVVGRSPMNATWNDLDTRIDIHPTMMNAAINGIFDELCVDHHSDHDVSSIDYLTDATAYMVNNIQAWPQHPIEAASIHDAVDDLMRNQIYHTKGDPIHD